MSDIRIGVGYSSDSKTEDAVRSAVAAARGSLGSAPPGLAVVAATVEHDPAAVAAAVRRELPDAGIHGATTSLGVLGNDGVVMGAGGGLGVLVFGSEPTGARFSVGHAPIAAEAREAGRKAAEALITRGAAGGAPGERPRILFIAATPGKEEDILRGIGDVVPDVPIFGGSAADHAIEGAWSVFTNDGAMRDAVSLAAIYGDVGVGGAFDGPYEATSMSEVITEADGRSIVTLGGKPASSVLHGWIGDDIGDQVRDGGNLLVQTALSPLGIRRESAEGGSHFVLLHPAHAHPGGSVDVFAEAPSGARVCLMRGSEESLVGIVDRLVDRSLKSAGLEPGGVRGGLLIYCAGCAGAVGSRINDVMSRLRARLGSVPVLGFCTFGEQGFVPGLGNIHSNLSVGLVLAG